MLPYTVIDITGCYVGTHFIYHISAIKSFSVCFGLKKENINRKRQVYIAHISKEVHTDP